MRANGIKRIGFSSTGSTYGECAVLPTPEDAPFPIQTSLYGASKVAGEGMIAAYAEGFGYEAYIFRFVSILGERYTHGHFFDFYKQLTEHPGWLKSPGRRIPAQELPLRAGLRGRHAPRDPPRHRPHGARHNTQVYKPGRAGIRAGERQRGLHLPGARPPAGTAVHRRRPAAGSATIRSSFWTPRRFRPPAGRRSSRSNRGSCGPCAGSRPTAGSTPSVSPSRARGPGAIGCSRSSQSCC